MRTAHKAEKGARPPIVLLGAQRFEPTLGAAMKEQKLAGKVGLVTAGWQERESEDEELTAHIGLPTENLKLHARGDQLFREDKELRAAHRERGEALRYHQDFYRIRLEHALDAARAISHREAPAEIAAEMRETSLAAIRALDAEHLATCARIHQAFEERWSLATRPSVAKHRDELAAIVKGCDAICIAGGHVATLVNRLALFGLGPLLRNRLLFAWSGGAMAISERVVLFHDDPPQGPGASEVLDAGLGLIPALVALPQPEQRLKLDNRERVQAMVQRFAPALCLALPARSRVTLGPHGFSSAEGVLELCPDGGNRTFQAGSR